MPRSKLLVKRLREDATIPTKGSKRAAGWDLYACEDRIVRPRTIEMIPTGIAVKVPGGTYGSIRGRSGLALRYGIDVFGGVIDEDYRGDVGVLLYNAKDEDFSVKRGDRIAQMIIEKLAKVEEVEETEELDETERGDGGFGSTGTQ
jgi:dUTP pyrophosphatase